MEVVLLPDSAVITTSAKSCVPGIRGVSSSCANPCLIVHKGRISLRLPAGPFCGQHSCSPEAGGGWAQRAGSVCTFIAQTEQPRPPQTQHQEETACTWPWVLAFLPGVGRGPGGPVRAQTPLLTAQQSHLFSEAKAVPSSPALRLFSLLFIPRRPFFSFFILSQQPAGNKGKRYPAAL